MRSIAVLLMSFLFLKHIQAQKIAAGSSSSEKWQTVPDKMEYKIIKSDSGKVLRDGNYMLLEFKQVYSGKADTILLDTRLTGPRNQVFDSTSVPKPFYNIFRQLKAGDSVTIRTLTEQTFKDSYTPMPDFMEKGYYLYNCIKLLHVFESARMADSAYKAAMKIAKPRIYADQMASIENEITTNGDKIEADGKLIEAFLLRNKLKAQKTRWGTYIVVKKEGTGKQVTSNCIVTMNYTGRIMKTGKVIDSNTMPSFHHVTPYEIDMSEPSIVIHGFYDGVLQLKKGARATLYIPSSLAYGINGSGALVKPGAILSFEITILTVEESR